MLLQKVSIECALATPTKRGELRQLLCLYLFCSFLLIFLYMLEK